MKSIRCKLGAAAVVVKLLLLSNYLVDLDIQQHLLSDNTRRNPTAEKNIRNAKVTINKTPNQEGLFKPFLAEEKLVPFGVF